MAHNGKLTQVNLPNIQGGGDYPFLNAVKNMQAWGFVDNSGIPTPDVRTANGYPVTLTNGGWYSVGFLPSAVSRPGNWVLKATGTGTLYLLSGDVVSGSLSGANPRVIFTPNSSDANGIFRVGAGFVSQTVPFTNIVLCHVNDEAAYDAGQIFTDDFKARCAQFGVIRFLNSQMGNLSNVVAWAHRTPINYAYYGGPTFPPDLYAGVTTNSGDDYSVAAPSTWGGLADKATALVKFNASATTDTPRLNIGGTGFKQLKSEVGDTLQLGYNNRPIAGVIGSVMYDADLDCWIKHGGDIDPGNSGIRSGIPIELCVQLCNEVGAHPWFVQPYLTSDPITDWPSSMMTYVKNNLNAGLIPHFESINEDWNSVFYGTLYGWNKAFAHWGTSFDSANFHGKIVSLLGQAASTVYSNDRTKYKVICGVQTYGDYGIPPAFSENGPRLNSDLYVANNSGSAAKNWVTDVCCANYFASTYEPAELTKLATDFAAASTLSQQQALAFRYAASVLVSGQTRPYGIPDVLVQIQGWYTFAQYFGKGLLFYEGGYSPDYLGSDNLDAVKALSKTWPGLEEAIRIIYVGISKIGGSYPSCFQLSGSGNAWSAYDPDIYSAFNPQIDGITNYNRKRSPLRLRIHS